MYEKYRSAAFGRCPHVFCQGQPVLPVGLSDLPRNFTVNVFCPRCHGLFFPKSTRQANIDGAYFGTTFPHLYLMTHPVSCLLFYSTDQHYDKNLTLCQYYLQDMVPVRPTQEYTPRVYGFKINEQSLYYRNNQDVTRRVESSSTRPGSARRRNRGGR